MTRIFICVSFLFGCLACKVKKPVFPEAQELHPPPSTEVLWSGCSEIPVQTTNGIITYTIAHHNYTLGKKLGEGGECRVFLLNSEDTSAPKLIMKFSKLTDDSKWAYVDILLHSSMEIIGVPTIKAGIGFTVLDGKRQYVLVKELVDGRDLDDMLLSASLNALNVFNPRVRTESEERIKLAARIVSKIINSGIYIDDLHSRNIMWDSNKMTFLVIDGGITIDSVKHKINPRKDFGRAIGIPSFGDLIFYERYYDKDIKASDAAIESAKKRIELYFDTNTVFQKDCVAPTKETSAPPFEIDVHKIFGGIH